MMNMMITAVAFIEMDKKHTGESVIVSLPKQLY